MTVGAFDHFELHEAVGCEATDYIARGHVKLRSVTRTLNDLGTGAVAHGATSVGTDRVVSHELTLAHADHDAGVTVGEIDRHRAIDGNGARGAKIGAERRARCRGGR